MCFSVMVCLCFAVEPVEGYHTNFSLKAWESSKRSTVAMFMLADEYAKNPFSGTEANWHKQPVSLLFNFSVCIKTGVISNQLFFLSGLNVKLEDQDNKLLTYFHLL